MELVVFAFFVSWLMIIVETGGGTNDVCPKLLIKPQILQGLEISMNGSY